MMRRESITIIITEEEMVVRGGIPTPLLDCVVKMAKHPKRDLQFKKPV